MKKYFLSFIASLITLVSYSQTTTLKSTGGYLSNNLVTGTTYTTTTQTQGDNSTKLATTAYVDTKKDYFFMTLSFNGLINPADATTYYFGATLNAPTTTATDNDQAIPNFAFTVVGAIINSGNNTAAGTTELSTLSLRNTTTSSSGTIGTFATNGSATVAINTTINGLSIPVAASNSICAEWLTPTWVTNPTAVRITITLICTKP